VVSHAHKYLLNDVTDKNHRRAKSTSTSCDRENRKEARCCHQQYRCAPLDPCGRQLTDSCSSFRFMCTNNGVENCISQTFNGNLEDTSPRSDRSASANTSKLSQWLLPQNFTCTPSKETLKPCTTLQSRHWTLCHVDL